MLKVLGENANIARGKANSLEFANTVLAVYKAREFFDAIPTFKVLGNSYKEWQHNRKINVQAQKEIPELPSQHAVPPNN